MDIETRRVLTVRGRPVLVENKGASAVEWPGYFPISQSGYRSLLSATLRPSLEIALEEIAVENDQDRAKALRRVNRAARMPAGTPVERADKLSSLVAAVDVAFQHAFLAPQPDQVKLLAAIAKAQPFLDGLDAADVALQGARTPENNATWIRDYGRLTWLVAVELKRLCDPSYQEGSWHTLVMGVPEKFRTDIPLIVRRAFGLTGKSATDAGVVDALLGEPS